MRATMELYGDAMDYPSIHAQVALGCEDLTVKVKLRCSIFICLDTKTHQWFKSIRPYVPLQVSDRGGGVPLRKIDRLFTYTYSTAPRPSFDGSRAAPLVSNSSCVINGRWKDVSTFCSGPIQCALDAIEHVNLTSDILHHKEHFAGHSPPKNLMSLSKDYDPVSFRNYFLSVSLRRRKVHPLTNKRTANVAAPPRVGVGGAINVCILPRHEHLSLVHEEIHT